MSQFRRRKDIAIIALFSSNILHKYIMLLVCQSGRRSALCFLGQLLQKLSYFPGTFGQGNMMRIKGNKSRCCAKMAKSSVYICHRAMLRRARYCYGKSSVRPSVTLRYRDHIGWNSSKIISPLVTLGSLLCTDQTSWIYSKGNTPKFWPE